MAIEVTGLALTPVKGTQLRAVDSVELDRHGVRGNRRFYLIDDEGEMVNALRLGLLNTIVSEYDDRRRRLSLTFPDGRVLEDRIELGEQVTTRFYDRSVAARLVAGAWSEAISDHVGKRLALVEAGDQGAVDRGPDGAVTLISQASLKHLAERAERPSVDGRRFRMLIEVNSVGPHEEDGWVGQTIRVGDAVLRGRGHVGRCAITNRDPESGEMTLQTLKILGGYRREVETTEPVAFGIYGEVLEPGTIRVGDAVEVDG